MPKNWVQALSTWHTLWELVRNEPRTQSSRCAAIFEKAHYFWMMAQIIMQRPGAVDVLIGMEVNCDDALLPLRALP